VSARTRTRLTLLALAASAASAFAGCAGRGSGEAEEPGPEPSPGGSIDFATQVQPIFDRYCSCHLSPSAPEGAVLLPEVAYDALVGNPSRQSPALLLVEPGEPDRSYLVIKIDDNVPNVASVRVGDLMPQRLPPLSRTDIDTIRQWIAEGAPRTVDRPDTTPPRFSGVRLAEPVSTTEIDLFWDGASDDETSAAEITYNVYRGAAPGAEDFAQPAATLRGATTVRVSGLDPDTEYCFVVRARDEAENEDTNTAEVCASTPAVVVPPFRRGDSNNDGAIELADAVFVLNYLFFAGPAPVCRAIADADADGHLNLTDAVFLLRHLFGGGTEPALLSEEELAECEGRNEAAIARGAEVFRLPDANGNLYACATCHASEPDHVAIVRLAGHSLHDALRRPSFKLGEIPTFLGAANLCREHWMQTTPWQETDLSYTDLVAFFESVAPPGPAPALVYEIVPPAVRGPASGNPDAGCDLFHRSCVVCHGEGAAGTPIAPGLVSFLLDADFIRLKIRLSGPRRTVYDGLRGGIMPFWTPDRLSDAEVEDVAAYLTTRPVVQCGEAQSP
jgi:mono/diheme cytochrome c family protein